MIQYFRKIRQSLLTENRLRKYLLYAIGEIVLVVIGILIALTISTWNEKKKDRELEVFALNSLYEELSGNEKELQRSIPCWGKPNGPGPSTRRWGSSNPSFPPATSKTSIIRNYECS